jgi:hypothetical protein
MTSKTILREVPLPEEVEEVRRQPGDRWRPLRSFWARILHVGRRRPRRLRLCESLPLGERRFVAVVEFERLRFLVGGTAASLVLLARLGSAEDNHTAPASAAEIPQEEQH